MAISLVISTLQTFAECYMTVMKYSIFYPDPGKAVDMLTHRAQILQIILDTFGCTGK
jgi:hypothetical protein